MNHRLIYPTTVEPRRFLVFSLFALSAMTAAPTAMAESGEQTLAWGVMSMQLFGGLALFLFGMEQMAGALKAVAGDRMKMILARLTTNRFMGAATGAFITAIVQSSSVTTVLVVGFITAGLMSMSQSIGIIMGANIGSTITAQLIAFKITKIALLMVAAGFSMQFISEHEKIQRYGNMLMGLGLVFFGMNIMSDGMEPLRSYPPFLDLMVHMESPWLGILVAALFTGLIQSSAATTGIVIVMASQGLVTLPTGIALAFGANIGTCVTALLAAIGKPREALRAATVHILFNIFGVLLWIGFIDQLAMMVFILSPSYEQLSGSARLAAETPRQIANAHTLFNVANTFIFIGLTGQFARLVEWLIPDRPLEKEAVIKPKYLDDTLLETPALALDHAHLEIDHMAQHVMEMLDKILPAVISGSAASLKRIAKMDDNVDILHGHIITFLGNLSKRDLSNSQTKTFIDLMAVTNNLENIGDLVETDMVELGQKRIKEEVTISEETRGVLKNLQDVALEAIQLALDAVIHNDTEAAQRVIAMKLDINRLTDEAAVHQAKRLVAKEPKRLQAYTIEIDTIEKQKRLYSFAKRMARLALTPEQPVVEKNSEEKKSKESPPDEEQTP